MCRVRFGLTGLNYTLFIIEKKHAAGKCFSALSMISARYVQCIKQTDTLHRNKNVLNTQGYLQRFSLQGNIQVLNFKDFGLNEANW